MSERRPLGRKIKKLRESPRLFLADARHPATRLLRAFVETGWPEDPEQDRRERLQEYERRAATAESPRLRPPPAAAPAPGAHLSLSPRELIERNGLFDAAYYLQQYEDVRKRKVKDLLEHYLRHGVAEQRHPNEVFDPRFYAQQARIKPTDAPLVHYFREGEAKGIWPHPRFDPVYYLAQNPDAVASGLGALVHYLKVGRREGRQTSANLQVTPGISLEHDLRQVPVTVLVPVYNNAEHVRRCIESVLANTSMPRAELLLIDDASTEHETR